MAACINSAHPGSKLDDRQVKSNTDMAVVGPEIICNEEPNNAAIMGVTIAV